MTHEAESATIWRALVKEFDKGERAQKERDRRNRLAFSLDDERLQDYLESRCMAYDVDPLPNFYPDGILSHFIRRSEQPAG